MHEKPKFGGMTVNERLVVARLIDQWGRAVNSRDRDAMIEILKSVELPETESGRITDAVLENPTKYGF
jgi:hypothetical protein